MGKTKQQPRYNVLSVRLSDYELREISEQISDTNATRQDFILQALLEKTTRDRQASMDNYLRGLGVTEL
jgi:hypothetical protein